MCKRGRSRAVQVERRGIAGGRRVGRGWQDSVGPQSEAAVGPWRERFDALIAFLRGSHGEISTGPHCRSTVPGPRGDSCQNDVIAASRNVPPGTGRHDWGGRMPHCDCAIDVHAHFSEVVSRSDGRLAAFGAVPLQDAVPRPNGFPRFLHREMPFFRPCRKSLAEVSLTWTPRRNGSCSDRDAPAQARSGFRRRRNRQQHQWPRDRCTGV